VNILFFTLLSIYLAVCPFPAVAAEDGETALFAQVVEQARSRATQAYVPLRFQLPQPLVDLNYDSYRAIRFQPAQSLWRGQGLFEIQFFHLGFLYHEPVLIHVVENGSVRSLSFAKELFEYGNTELKAQLPNELGFAGFRVHYQLHRPDYADEVAVFLGASYFRMVGRNQHYGISARGLAINTALPEGEEFPAFREFWLVQPAPDATSLTVYALLDSQSVTGAYRFQLTPGTETALEVQATLFARAEVKRLGIAPLTSMFFTGENQVRAPDDYRPEVHDSDGLLLHTGKGERIWRPLSNPHELRVSSFLDENPAGFGLLQRDRNFAHYLDLESHFERRPSFWVEPRGAPWGKGAVHLIEIPVHEEIHDNIVAFWVADQPLKAGESRTFAYRLLASLAPPLTTEPLGYVERTRSGWGAGSRAKDTPRSLRRFIVDFTGGDLPTLAATQPVTAEISASAGVVSEPMAQRLPDAAGWRATFLLAPDGATTSDLRLFLTFREKRLTEIWNYVWSTNDND
jgi:periplasmic glucans biosynthesis protein